MKVAIIGGSGKMGRWFARFLLKDGKGVIITGRNEEKLQQARQQLGVEIASNAEAAKVADVIIISVPIDNFESVVKEFSPFVKANQIVIDITSIKVFPVNIMHKYIKTGRVLGIHPLFGPGAPDISKQNFVLTPTSDGELTLAKKVAQYLEAHGARTTMMSPPEHDEMMSVILGLSHFIAIIAVNTLLDLDSLKEMETIGGSTFRLLLTLAKSVMTEDPEFYACLQMKLPGMSGIHELFQKNAASWAGIVKSQDKQEFARKMNTLRDKLEKVDPDFRKAYENMYRLLDS